MQFVAPPPDLLPWIEGGVILRAPASLVRSCFPARVSSQWVLRLEGSVRLGARAGGGAGGSDNAGGAGGPLGALLPPSAFIGPSAVPTHFVHDGAVAALGLILRPEAVAGWLGPEGAALAEQVGALDDLLGPAWAPVEDAVRQAGSDRAGLEILFGALRRAVRQPRQDERRRQALLLRRLVCAGPDAAVAAARLGIGHRQLQRRFQATFGLSPTPFRSLTRLRMALHSALDRAIPGAELALACGFYDQSHLGRDVRRLAGLSLPDLLRQARPAPDGAPGSHWAVAIGARAADALPALLQQR